MNISSRVIAVVFSTILFAGGSSAVAQTGAGETLRWDALKKEQEPAFSVVSCERDGKPYFSVYAHEVRGQLLRKFDVLGKEEAALKFSKDMTPCPWDGPKVKTWTSGLSKIDPIEVSADEHVWVLRMKGPGSMQLPPIALLKEGIPNVVSIHYLEGRYSIPQASR